MIDRSVNKLFKYGIVLHDTVLHLFICMSLLSVTYMLLAQ